MADWIDPHRMDPREYKCGYCGNQVASERGYAARYGSAIYMCPKCSEPTYFDLMGQQIPGVPYGDAVASLPNDVETLYGEARRVIAVGAPTSSVMAARKLLMHVAVEKGAKPNQTLLDYVDYLTEKGYVPQTESHGSTRSGRRETKPTTKSL